MRIAINGAGIAGPTLAYWLERSGHEPTLIEKAPRFRTGGYVIDFWGVGYTVAERMGILPAVHRAGYVVEEVRLVDRQGGRTAGFSADVFRRMTDGRFISLPRGDLAAAIYASIDGRVETLFGNSISALDSHSKGLRVEFEYGPARDFDLVVGADGLHSQVREMVFGPQRRFERSLGYRVAAFEVHGYQPRDEQVYVSYSIPGRQVARFSLRNDCTMVLFVFVADCVSGPEPASTAQCKALLHEVYGDAGWECPAILRAMDRVENIYFDKVSQIRLGNWSSGRVILIGDAASCVSLLAGEGTGLAMTQAYVLAGELSGADDDHREAFRRYQQRLRPFINGKQVSAERFASSFAPRTTVGLWMRNLATRLMSFPRLADLIIGRDLRDDFELPEYPMQDRRSEP